MCTSLARKTARGAIYLIKWGIALQEDEEDRVVGTVSYSKITRHVSVFRATEEDNPS